MSADPLPLFNAPVEFTCDGTTYRPRRLTLDEFGAFCAWLEEQAVEKAWTRSANLPPEARDASLKAANANIAAGAFQVGGAGYTEAMRSASAGAYLMYLALRDDHPKLTLDDCVKMFLEKLDERARDALARGRGDPSSSGGRKGSSGPKKKSSRSSRKKASRRR